MRKFVEVMDKLMALVVVDDFTGVYFKLIKLNIYNFF